MPDHEPISETELCEMWKWRRAATPEPWEVREGEIHIEVDPVCNAVKAQFSRDNNAMRTEALANAHLMTVVFRLLDEVDRLRDGLEALRLKFTYTEHSNGGPMTYHVCLLGLGGASMTVEEFNARIDALLGEGGEDD